MKIINQSAELLTPLSQEEVIKRLEMAGRVCYKSEHKISDNSGEKFVRNIIKHNHQSVLEHISLSIRFITDRGVTHELVRHRLISASMESTRYVRYANGMEFVAPVGMSSDGLNVWVDACAESEKHYLALLVEGEPPEQARSVLNHSVKTEIIVTANLREWMHIIKLRGSKAAHPQIRELIRMTEGILVEKYPVIFGKEC